MSVIAPQTSGSAKSQLQRDFSLCSLSVFDLWRKHDLAEHLASFHVFVGGTGIL